MVSTDFCQLVLDLSEPLLIALPTNKKEGFHLATKIELSLKFKHNIRITVNLLLAVTQTLLPLDVILLLQVVAQPQLPPLAILILLLVPH